MQRSLEAFERSGNRGAAGRAPINLGVVCQWEGRWDEALVVLRAGSRRRAEDRQHGFRGRFAHQHLGDPGRSRRVGRGRSDASGNAAAMEGVGVSLLAGRLPLLARTRVSASGSLRRGIGAPRRSQSQLPDVGAEPAGSAGRRVDRGVPRRHGRSRRRSRAGTRDISVAPRSRATSRRSSRCSSAYRVTRCCCRTICGVRAMRWRASLAAARERHDLFEATLTMLSLIELDRLEGVEPPLEMVNETRGSACEPQGTRRSAGAAPASASSKKERPRRAAHKIPAVNRLATAQRCGRRKRRSPCRRIER